MPNCINNSSLSKRFTLIYARDVLQEGAGGFSADLSAYKMALIVCRRQDSGTDFVTAVVPIAMYTDASVNYRIECDGVYRDIKPSTTGISWGAASGNYPTAFIIPNRIYGL